MKIFISKFGNNLILDLLVTIFLSHIYYKITFTETVTTDFSLLDQIKNNYVTTTSFFVESPTFAVLGIVLNLENLDTYKLLIYLVAVICLVLIVVNIQFLGKYSTLFLFGGWLVTCSWFVGYVDSISALIMVLIFKEIFIKEFSISKILLLFTILCINHNGISMAVSLIYLVLINKKYRVKFTILILVSQLIGNTLVQFYLNYIGFSGRGRFRFIFNENVIENAVNFLGNNLLAVLWSGFLGSSFLILLIANVLSWDEMRKVFIAIVLALLFTSIALDTSRIFSILVLPIILYSLKEFKDQVTFENKLSILYSVSLVTHFTIGVYFFYGALTSSSPMNFSESFYDFIPRIVNSLMSNIWK